jgi:hypothetical protein
VKAFLNEFIGNYRKLQNVSENSMDMERCIRWLLKNLGDVGGPNGYLREQVNEINVLLRAEPELVTPGTDFVAAYLRDGDPPTLVQAIPAQPPVYRSKVTWQKVEGILLGGLARHTFNSRSSRRTSRDSRRTGGTVNLTASVPSDTSDENKLLKAKVAQLEQMIVLLTSKDEGKNKNKPLCFNWRDYGECQFKDKCRYSHDPKHKGKKKKPRAEAVLSNSDNGAPQIVFLCVDGGANVHVICSVHLFRRMTNVRLVDEQVMMNNHGSPVKARGDLEILIDGNKINLYDVAYIPESAHNIISVSHILDREGGAVRYTKNTITLLREGKRPVKGFRRGGLYFFSDAFCGGQENPACAKDCARD